MRYQFEGKFHRTDRHTIDQRVEMAMLINGGVPYRVIENAYDANPHTLRVVSRLREQWVNGQLARSEEEKFAYAQRLYVAAQNPDVSKIVDDAIIKPFSRAVSARLLAPEPKELLLEEILGENPRASKAHAANVFALVHMMVQGTLKMQKTYRDEDNAVWELTLPVREYLAARETPQLRAWRIMRDSQLDKFLTTLTATEQDVIRKFYGIGFSVRSLPDIAKDYDGRPKQWAHKIKRDALNQIRPEMQALYAELLR